MSRDVVMVGGVTALDYGAMNVCLFCGKPFGTQRKRTDEHGAPKWCRKLVPDRGKARHTAIIETVAGQTIEDRGLHLPFTTVIADVCEQCNTGWMHELEETCRSFLGHLIQGDHRSLRFWRQALVSTWAVKTAMVWDAVSVENRAIPVEMLRRFHRMQSAGGAHQVWIGRYIGDDPHTSRRAAAHVIGRAAPTNPGRADAYLVVFTIGQLVLVVFGQVFRPMSIHALPSTVASALIQIWPPSQEVVAWPPADSLDNAGLEACARSLGAPVG